MKYITIQLIIFSMLAIITCIGITACSAWRPFVCKAPLHYINEAPVVEVMINEQGPFTFIIDTGGSVGLCLARSGLIEQLKLEEQTESIPTSIHSQLEQDPLTFPVFGPATISIDQLSISNISFIKLDDLMNHHLFHNGLDGIISTGVLANLNLVIVFDFVEQEFRVGRSAKTLGLVSAEKVATVFLSGKDPNPLVGVTINAGGLDIPALLDTGSVFGLGLPMTYRSQLSIPTEETSIVSLTIGGKMTGIRSTLDGDLIIGRHTISNPTVRFTNTRNPYANIGSKILKEFHVIGFDYANNQIYLRR